MLENMRLVNQVFWSEKTETSTRVWAGDVRNRGIRTVCADCNSGWMSSIEEMTRPVLEPLIRGQSSFLDQKAQKTLATWSAMKTMIAEYHDPGRVAGRLRISVGAQEFALILGQNWRIWIGNYERRQWNAHLAHATAGIASVTSLPRIDPTTPNTQTTTVTVGKLFAHAFSSEIELCGACIAWRT